MATSACGCKCCSARTGCRRRRGWSGGRSRRSTARSCVEWTLSTSETNKCELPLRLQLNKPNNFLSAAFAACHHSKCADSESQQQRARLVTLTASVVEKPHRRAATVSQAPATTFTPQHHLPRTCAPFTCTLFTRASNSFAGFAPRPIQARRRWQHLSNARPVQTCPPQRLDSQRAVQQQRSRCREA